MSLFAELRRRNVFRVGIAYLVGAWLLLQLTDVLSELLDLPPQVGPVVVAAVAIGFPIVLFAAWAYELTPQGIKRESEVRADESITRQTGRKLNALIIGMLVVALAYFVWEARFMERHDAELTEMGSESFSGTQATQQNSDEERGPDPVSADKNSIAVLPFVNMSADPDNEYFSDGLTETLLHMLAQLPELRVAARTSSFSFKGKDASINEIADALNVAHVLEGSVQKAGNQVRVTAQLIRADDGFHLWSQNYTRPLEDIFAIQDEIATDVANALDASLLGAAESDIEGPATSDVDAYEIYLKALNRQATFSFGSLEAAEGLFKEALAADPGFVDARIGLARNYLLMYGTGMFEVEEAQRRLDPLLEQIRADRPDSPHARAFELWIENTTPGVKTPEEIREVLNELLGLLVVIPDETILRNRVAGMVRFLEQDEAAALEILQAGLLVDPRSAYLHAQIGNRLRRLERYDEAQAALERAMELDPGLPAIYVRQVWLAEDRDDLKGALDWARRAVDVDPRDHELAVQLARKFYQLELSEEGDRWARRVEALVPGSDFVRSLAIERAESREEWERVMELAAELITGEPNYRGGIFNGALAAYGEAAIHLGRAREAYDFFTGIDPEVLETTDPASERAIVDLRMHTLRMMTQFAARDELVAFWEDMTVQFETLGWQPGPFDRLIEHTVRGEYDQAVSPALEIFSRPLAENPDRGLLKVFSITWPELAQQPEVAARLSEREREWQALREDVIAMLAEPEWQ